MLTPLLRHSVNTASSLRGERYGWTTCVCAPADDTPNRSSQGGSPATQVGSGVGRPWRGLRVPNSDCHWQGVDDREGGGADACADCAQLAQHSLPCRPAAALHPFEFPVPLQSMCRLLTALPRPALPLPAGPLPTPAVTASAYFEAGGRQPTPAYLLTDLKPGHAVTGGSAKGLWPPLPVLTSRRIACKRWSIGRQAGGQAGGQAGRQAGPQPLSRPFHAHPSPRAGPAMLIDNISTIVLEPGCTAHVTAARDVRIELGSAPAAAGGAAAVAAAADGAAAGPADTECDPIQLAIFSHR